MDNFFDYQGNDCHLIYKNFRQITDDEAGRHIKYLRDNIAEMWDRFKPYADSNFKEEFRRNPDQRYWEMYLGSCLLERGLKISAPKPGPDFCLDVDGRKVWIEAVTASPGQEDHPDRVPEIILLSDGGGGASRSKR